ncbi:MAG TPA: ABC transporter permease [Anaerolineaceae bacterium]|nr:ABC transporter permease [Anaerolineaceae bacterium]HPN52035.1 ABC transporter permease [Anaerolineaceae bacterium]
MKLWLFMGMALRNLRQGGQRIWIALLCIIFGVMSLTAMNMLSDSIMGAILVDGKSILGGDVLASYSGAPTLPAEEQARLAALQQQGVISAWTIEEKSYDIAFRQPGSVSLKVVMAGIGIDPQVYPLAGRLEMLAPQNAAPADLLRGKTDLLITRDLAEDKGIVLGDTLLVSDLNHGEPLSMTVRGIIDDNPDHEGSRLYYTHEAAMALSGLNGLTASRVQVLAPDPGAVQAALGNDWWVMLASDWNTQRGDSQNYIEICLRGAGIMGLLVGGIGVANTMLVLLRRRMGEMAILKTVGYSQADLNQVFLLEATLLGLLGSGIGLLLAVLISSSLGSLFDHITQLLLEPPLFPPLLITGGLIGLATTLIFAELAVVLAGEAQPSALLRGDVVSVKRTPWVKVLLTAAALGAVFTLLASLAMGSLGSGLLIMAVALGGLLILGGCLNAAVWVMVHLLPTWGLPALRLVKQHLRQRGVSLTFSMIAMFAGMVPLALGLVVLNDGQRELSIRVKNPTGANMAILAGMDDEASLRQTLEKAGLNQPVVETRAVLQQAIWPDAPYQNGDEARQLSGELISMDSPLGLKLTGAPWGSVANGVYLPAYEAIPVGSQLIITTSTGATHAVTVVGSYEQEEYNGFRYYSGLLTGTAAGRELAPVKDFTAYISVPQNQMARSMEQISAALPQVTIVDIYAYLMRETSMYRDLFLFAAAMAGLALLAGGLLLANTLSLAMLDRRYEIGVLKAVGYTRRHILVSMIIEYALVGLLVSSLSLLAVKIFLLTFASVNATAEKLFTLELPIALVALWVSLAVTLATVLLVTWGAVQTPALVVLNDQR